MVDGFWEQSKELLKSPQRAAQKTAKEFPLLQKLSDLVTKVAETPGADIGMVPLGLTRQEIGQHFLRNLFQSTGGGKLSNTLRGDIANSLRVVAKAPKKVVRELSKFSVEPSKNTTGFYSWSHPKGERFRSPSKINIEIGPYSLEPTQPLAGTLGHELGHGAARRIMERSSAPSLMKSTLYDTMKGQEWEGIAEYLGTKLRERAGVESSPVFGYPGSRQPQAFNELSQMGSKNPYLNVYRYLQNLLRR